MQSSAHEEKLSWEDLLQYDNNPPIDRALPRTKTVQKRYGGYLGALKKRGTTIEQDVMNRMITNHTNQQLIVTKNDFPYNIDDNVLHLVVWINPLMYIVDDAADTPAAYAFAREYIQTLAGHWVKFIMFENLPGNKSVGNVRHFQLFIHKGDVGMLPIEKL